jgi:hypothetical protein
MRTIENESFYALFDRGEKLFLKDIRLEGCSFTHSGISMTTDVNRMTTVRNAQLINCTVDGVSVGPTIFHDVTITNLRTSDLFIVWCPYLDRVTLSGEIGKMKINATARPSTFGNEKQRAFDDYRSEFYADVDWALDISEARFREFDIDGVPSRLVRRDPESQIVVTRERALQVATPGWETRLRSTDTHLPFTIKLFLSDGDPELILVAPLGAAKAERDAMLRGLRELRAIGLAEPD